MWRRIVLTGLISVGIVAAFAAGVNALEVPKAPPLDRPIIDTTSTLSEQEINQLAEQINKSRSEKSYQLGILMIPSLGSSESIEGFSIKVAREWGIGDKDKDNGVLLIIAKDDRKLRIEVGRGLEGDITDAESGRIIRNVISPEFKKSNYYLGISKAINSIQLAVEGKADSSADNKLSGGDIAGMIVALLYIIGFPLMYVISLLARSKSWWAGGVVGGVVGAIVSVATSFNLFAVLGSGALIGLGLLIDYLVSKNYRESKQSGRSPDWWAGGSGGWGGGSWGGGSSGGGSFGGGGFSGGGSSGSW